MGGMSEEFPHFRVHMATEHLMAADRCPACTAMFDALRPHKTEAQDLTDYQARFEEQSHGRR